MIPPKEEILNVKKEIENHVKKRLSQFKNLKRNGYTKFNFKPFLDIDEYSADIFSEACFCLLTASSSASLGIKLQKNIGIEGFKYYSFDELFKILKEHGHRFPNQRAERIIKLREKKSLLDKIIKEKNSKKLREILVKEIYGFGFKEASHFLRNIGYEDLAIIDRHISRYLFEKNLVKPRRTITKKVYIECENILNKICTDLNISQAELDLYIFYIKTGKVLK